MASSVGLYVVKTPYAQHVSSNKDWLEIQAKKAVSDCIKVTDEGKVEDCYIGNGHCLVSVDKAEAVDMSLNQQVPGAATIVSVVTEATSLIFTGDLVMNIPLTDIRHILLHINPSLQCRQSHRDSSLTITGRWSDLQHVRVAIHKLLLHKMDETDAPALPMHEIEIQKGFAGLTLGHDRDETRKLDMHADFEYKPSPPTIPSNKLQRQISSSSHYDMLTDMSPDIITLMKHSRIGFQTGVEYKEGKKTVHFTFPSQESLNEALTNFEQAYNSLEKKGVESKSVSLPTGVHVEELGQMISELESKFEDTVINWVPENLEFVIVSTQADKVQNDLENQMESMRPATVRTDKKAVSSGGNTFGSEWVKQKIFGSGKPKNVDRVQFRSDVVLQFKNGRSLTLRHGNLLKETVGAIVNPANKHLSHGAGIAKQINEASGGKIYEYSIDVLERHGGYINTGTAVSTRSGGGQLQCQYVIHVVGPNAHEIKSEPECIRLLKAVVLDALREGCYLKLHSIAIPAISSGLFGMDKDLVAETIIDTLVDYQKRKTRSECLGDIRIVIWDKETYYPFLNYITSVEASLENCQY